MPIYLYYAIITYLLLSGKFKGEFFFNSLAIQIKMSMSYNCYG